MTRKAYYIVMDNGLTPEGVQEYQSVFPAAEADYSQFHSSTEDAIEYIRECAGRDVIIEVPA